MIIYNNCSSNFNNNEYSLIETLIWVASVIQNKNLGYQTRLYCKSDEITKLKKYHIYELYDYIDTKTFDKNKKLKIINKNFWSTRKIEAINKEIKKTKNSIYMDTDIILFKPIEKKDCVVWACEQDRKMYQDINCLSMPKKYKFKHKDINYAYNMGIVYLNNKKIWKKYYKEYYKFSLNNPCKILNEDYLSFVNNIFACNAEQKLFAIILKEQNIIPNLFCIEEKNSVNNLGCHFYLFKQLWKNLIFLPYKNENRKLLVKFLNDVIQYCLKIIKNYDETIFNFYKNIFKEKVYQWF